MAQAVVVGASVGGLAAAARLAKLGHAVTLCERTDRIGGTLRAVRAGGFCWDAGPATMTLPAAVRDLFHKTGRPLERVLELTAVPSARRHVFPDGSTLDLPATGRSEQAAAIRALAGAGPASEWTALLDAQAPTWELLRTRALEVPYSGVRTLGIGGLRTLRLGHSLRGIARRGLSDPRLRSVLEHHAVAFGEDPSRTPAFLAVHAYLERTFGRWTCPGGLNTLAGALRARLEDRKVTVLLGCEAAGITTAGAGARGADVSGIDLADGRHLPATIVVWTAATRPPTGAAGVRGLGDRVAPASEPTMTHLGLEGPLPRLPYESVWHAPPGDARQPTLVVRAPDDANLAPPERSAWSVLTFGGAPDPGDPLEVLAARGLDLRERVVTRTDTAPARDGATAGSSSRPFGSRPFGSGPTWRVRPHRHRRANQLPISGLYAAGAHAHPGPGIPFEALGAALVAELVGPAPRSAPSCGRT